MLREKEIAEFHDVLVELEARVRGDYQHLTDEALEAHADSRSPTHMAELGTDAYEQEFSLRVAESDEQVLAAIRDALKRIKDGTFGLCEGCLAAGKPPSRAAIPKRRLREIPYARNCVACERDQEVRKTIASG